MFTSSELPEKEELQFDESNFMIILNRNVSIIDII